MSSPSATLMFLTLSMRLSPWGPAKTGIGELMPTVSETVGPGWGLGVCICNKLPCKLILLLRTTASHSKMWTPWPGSQELWWSVPRIVFSVVSQGIPQVHRAHFVMTKAKHRCQAGSFWLEQRIQTEWSSHPQKPVVGMSQKSMEVNKAAQSSATRQVLAGTDTQAL